MLWAYFDESGEHEEQSGHLLRLTMGGGISCFSDWEALSMRWAKTLERFGVPMFHMAVFEARRPPFSGWAEAKRRCLLKELLDLAVEHVAEFVGYVGQPEKGHAVFAGAYETTAAKAVREAAFDAYDEPMTFVFARHKEFSAAKLRGYLPCGTALSAAAAFRANQRRDGHPAGWVGYSSELADRAATGRIQRD